jgi:flagellin
MSITSINTNIAAYYAQQNIGKASSSASSSVARLSSGNRIVRASDDVASLAAGTSLRTQVTTLRMAMINTSQGASLLQVADGALAQIIDILQRQKAIAIQAGAGSMGAEERGFLNQEFSELTSEIDRITTTTNFNGVSLLDGSLFDKVVPTTASNNAVAASGAIALNTTLAGGKTLIFNGVTFSSTITAGAAGGTTFYSGDVSGMVDSLVQLLNASTNIAISGATYSRSGNSVVITQDAGGGAIGRAFSFDVGTVGLGVGGVTVSGIQSSGAATRYFLQGGTESGIGFGRTTAAGVIGDNILTGQNQIKANQQLTMPPVPTANVTATFSGKGITFNDGANLSFNFVTIGAATGNATEVIIGATLEETLDNAVQTLRSYAQQATAVAGSATSDRRILFDQFEFNREGRQINIERKAFGNVFNVGAAGAGISFGTSITGGGPISGAGSFANGNVTGGVSVNGVQNKDFAGTISGFKATYTNNVNLINLEVTVGGVSYNAFNVATAPVANTTIRFTSQTGGYFEVEMAANNGATVTSQTESDVIAARFNAAFAGLSFYQNRDVTSYNGAGAILTNGVVTGSLTGTSVRIQGESFADLAIQDINVLAPAPGTSNGIVEIVVNGETYRSGDIGSVIRPNALIRLTNLTDANKFIEFFGPAVIDESTATTSALAIDFSTSERAVSFENALKNAFGFNSGGASLSFQVGTTTEDTLKVSIGTASSSNIFGGQPINVLTQADAANASDVVDNALNIITSIRANVGALQSRFNYASNNIESSLQNQDAARGTLLDTDVAAESTAYATAQVQLQAGIAVLAQANQLPQNLLKLIG